MRLMELAERHLGLILEDMSYGPGWPITVTNPSGKSESGLFGFVNDISQIIDPDTGQAVSGRSASVAIRIGALKDAGFTAIPQGIHDESTKPWIVNFDDVNGESYQFKVAQSNPDRTIGLVVCLLATYGS